jgi:hypothetical protein
MTPLRDIDKMHLRELRATLTRIASDERLVTLRKEQMLEAEMRIAHNNVLLWELAAELARNGIDETQYDKQGCPITPKPENP